MLTRSLQETRGGPRDRAVGAGGCSRGWHSRGVTRVPACRQQRVAEAPGGRVQVLRAPLDVGAGAAHLQLVPGRAGVRARRGRAALPGPEPEEGTGGDRDVLGCQRAPLPPWAAPSPASSILCWRDVIWGRPGAAGVSVGRVRWGQVPVAGCGFGAQQGDDFCPGAGCRGAARSRCLGWPWLSPRTPSLGRALTCPLRACSSPGARSSTGGSGCRPTRTTGGSSESETEPPRAAGLEVPPRGSRGGARSQFGRATGPVHHVTL